ncbi:hypothetical protein ACFWXK_39670 [Streptomyces sp. NPDC059070]
MTARPAHRLLTRIVVLASCLPYALVLLGQECKARREACHYTARNRD